MAHLPEVVQRYIVAYNQKDVDGMMDCLSDQVTFQNIADGEVTATATGRREFQELASLGTQLFESRTQEVVHAISVADTTLVEIRFVAKVAKNPPNGWTAGQELQFSGTSAFRVEGEKIISIVDES